MSSIDNLSMRGFAGNSDYAKMAKLIQEIAIADHATHWTTTEDIENDYRHLTNSDPATDMCMVVDNEDTLVAYVRVFWNDDEAGRQIFGFPFNVHPNLRTLDLNRRLLRWVQQRCTQLARPGQPLMRTMLHNIEKETILKDALELEGFQAARYNYRMQRSLDNPIEILPLPAGLEVHPVSEALFRRVADAVDEAFRDHWGYTPMTEETYQQYRHSPQFKPDLWQVAWDGDQVAGGILNYIDEEANRQFNLKRGWTDPIFTRRPWRKRGLARALLMRSLQMFKDMGMTEAALSVDTQNQSGALGFYESCGFTMESQSIFYEKELNVALT
jgi:mycothiol synthase